MKLSKEIVAQIQPTAADTNEELWVKFFIQNSWVFAEGAPSMKTMEDVREMAQSDWAGVSNHLDSSGKSLEDGFGSWFGPRVIDKVVRHSEDAPPIKPIASFIHGTADFDQTLSHEVQMHSVGAEFEDDELWAARVWNKRENCEVQPRIYAHSLGAVMAEIYRVLRQVVPNFGDPEWNAKLDHQEADSHAFAEFAAEEAAEQAIVGAPVRFGQSGAAEE